MTSRSRLMALVCALTVSRLLAPTVLAQRLEPRIETGGDLINDVDQAAVALHSATPYLESSTMLLVEIDLTKFDVEATAKWWRESVGDANTEAAAAMVRGVVDSMKNVGVTKVLVTAATRSAIDGGPIVIIPCENPTAVNGLLEALLKNAPADSQQKTHVAGNVVLAGPASAIDRITAAKGIERPDLILPLKHGDRLDHTMVMGLPEEAQRDLVALWPDRLPKDSPIELSPRELAADISRIIVSWRLPPQPTIEIDVETPDAGAADRVKEVLEKVIALGGQAKSSIRISVDVATVKLRASPKAFADVAKAIAAPQRKLATQSMTLNRLKQIGLAFHSYYGKEKHLPPRCFTDNEGKPLLSWRVAILPYIEQAAMYNAMRLDEAWNSQHNLSYVSIMIPTYCEDSSRPDKTTIRVPVYPGSLWEGEGPPKDFRDVTDGTSNTIAAIDAPKSAAVEWANPQPWVLSVDDPMSDVFGDRDAATVVLLDGAALVLKKSEMTNEKLKAMLTIAGGEAIER